MGSASLGHMVYCKPTHYNLHLNSISHHHQANKHAIISTMVHSARALCDQDSLPAEMLLLRDIFRWNRYIDLRIFGLSVLPQKFLNPTISQIGSFPAVCLVSGQSRITRDWRYQEYIASPVNVVRYILHRQGWHQVEGSPPTYLSGTSGQVKHVSHSINLGHCIQVHNTRILPTKLRYMIRIIREVTKVELHPAVRMASVQVSHGHLPSAPQKISGGLSTTFLELLSLWGHILAGVYTLLLSGHQLRPLWTIISPKPKPCWPGFPPLLLLLNLHHMLRTYTHNFSPTLLGSPLLFPGPVQIELFSSLAG